MTYLEKISTPNPVRPRIRVKVGGEVYRIRWQDSIWVVPPPQIQTVKKTTSRVVENIIWRAYVAVSLIDRAKVIAPRSPEEQRTLDTRILNTVWVLQLVHLYGSSPDRNFSFLIFVTLICWGDLAPDVKHQIQWYISKVKSFHLLIYSHWFAANWKLMWWSQRSQKLNSLHFVWSAPVHH